MIKIHWNIENNSNQYMKNIVNKINEGKYCRLFSEVQNESDTNAEYHTFNISDGQKKFKKGFLTFNEDGNFFTITAFNNSKDLAKMIGADEDTYKSYDDFKVGVSGSVEENDGSETQVIRIW